MQKSADKETVFYLLAAGGVSSQNVGVLQNGHRRGLVGADLEDAAPLGEAAAGVVVRLAALGQVVQTLGGRFAVGALEGDHAGVDLDAGNDAALLEHLGEGRAGGVLVVDGLVEEDDAADVAVQLGGRAEEQVAVGATGLLLIGHANVGEALANGRWR